MNVPLQLSLKGRQINTTMIAHRCEVLNLDLKLQGMSSFSMPMAAGHVA